MFTPPSAGTPSSLASSTDPGLGGSSARSILRTMRQRGALLFVLAAFLTGVLVAGTGCGTESGTGDIEWEDDAAPHNGTWTLVKSKSSAIDPWRRLQVSIDADRSSLTVVRTWTGTYKVTSVDSVRIPMDGARHEIPIPQWHDNRHIAVRPTADSIQHVSARWIDRGRTLAVETHMPVLTSQGETNIRVHSEYRIAPDGQRLDVLELRSSRPRPIHYVLEPDDPEA